VIKEKRGFLEGIVPDIRVYDSAEDYKQAMMQDGLVRYAVNELGGVVWGAS